MHKLRYLFLSVIGLFFLTSCSEQRGDLYIDNASTYDNKLTNEITSQKDKGNLKDEHYTNVLGKIHIDASITTPNKTDFPTFIIGDTDFLAHAQKIESLFFPKGNVHHDKNASDDAYYATQDNSKLTIYNNSFMNYHTSLGQNIDDIFQPDMIEVPGLTSSVNDSIQSILSDQSSVLDFLTRDEAVDLVIQYLNEIDPTIVISKSKVYTLGHEKIISLKEALIEDDFFLKPIENINFTSEEDCYYIVLTPEIEGVDLESTGYTHQASERSFRSTYITAIVSRNGIELLNISQSYSIIKEDSINNEIVSIEDAINSFKNKYDNNILTEEINVSEITFCYIPIPIAKSTNQYKLVPGWSIRSYTMQDNFKISNTTLVNAITGEEIF